MAKKRKRAGGLSARAGLVVPVKAIKQTLVRGRYAEIVSKKAAVFLTGVLEYLVVAVLTLARQTALLRGSNKITLHRLPGLQDKTRFADLLKVCSEGQSRMNDQST